MLEPNRCGPPSLLVLTLGLAGDPFRCPPAWCSPSPGGGVFLTDTRSLLQDRSEPAAGLAVSTARGDGGGGGDGRTRALYAGARGATLLPGNVEAWPRGLAATWRRGLGAGCKDAPGPAWGNLSWVVPYLLVLVFVFLPPLLPPPPNRHVVSEPLAPFNLGVLSL